MDNITATATRLIANAYLYSKEKGKTISGYRFDNSFLTNRGITSIDDLSKLQQKLNKLGWCFNILSFNDFVIQEKNFLAEMTRLGFSRIKEKSDNEIAEEYLCGLHNRTAKLFEKELKELFGDTNVELNNLIDIEKYSKSNLPLSNTITINETKLYLTTKREEYYGNNIITMKMKLTTQKDSYGEIILPATNNLIKDNCRFIKELITKK